MRFETEYDQRLDALLEMKDWVSGDLNETINNWKHEIEANYNSLPLASKYTSIFDDEQRKTGSDVMTVVVGFRTCGPRGPIELKKYITDYRESLLGFDLDENGNATYFYENKKADLYTEINVYDVRIVSIERTKFYELAPYEIDLDNEPLV